MLVINFEDKRSPGVALLIVDHEGVLGKSCIDEGVDIDVVNWSRFKFASFVIFFEVHLENISRLFWVLDFEIFGEIDIEFGEELIGNDVIFLFIKVGDKDLLPCSIEG